MSDAKKNIILPMAAMFAVAAAVLGGLIVFMWGIFQNTALRTVMSNMVWGAIIAALLGAIAGTVWGVMKTQKSHTE